MSEAAVVMTTRENVSPSSATITWLSATNTAVDSTCSQDNATPAEPPVTDTVVEVSDLITRHPLPQQGSNLKKTTSLTVPERGSFSNERSHSLASTWMSSQDFDVQDLCAPEQESTEPRVSLLTEDSFIKSAIPCLPLVPAVICLILNIFFPGLGTVFSGLSVLCCGKPRIESKENNVATTMCVNLWVGVAQCLTVVYLLVGWFWSLAWGIKIVFVSIEYQREEKVRREKELQTMALTAFGSAGKGFVTRLGQQRTSVYK